MGGIAGSQPRTRPSVTSVDVARRAGVSQTTVSLVLSGKAAGRISDATAEAVQRAARELGYRPHAAAARCAPGISATVGLVVADVTHPFFGLTLRGAHNAAREAGHVVVLIDDDYGTRGETAIETLQHGAIDGFVFFAADPPASLRDPGAPPVVVVESEALGLPNVRLDVESGTDEALAHLHELGHRRIGLLRSAIRGRDVRPPPRPLARAPACQRRGPRRPGRRRHPVHGQGDDRRRARVARAPRRTRPPSSATTTCIAAGMLAAAQAEGVDVPVSCPSSASTTSTSRA